MARIRFCSGWLATAILLATALLSPAAAIIGGERSPWATYPFMAALIEHGAPPGEEGKYQFCGGTLIAPQWILTAADCLYLHMRQQSPNETDIYLGSSDFNHGDRIEPDRFVVHPQYNRIRAENNIALVHLARPPGAKLAVNPAPLKLSTDRTLEDSSRTRPAKVIGWGPTDYDATAPSPDIRSIDLELRWAVMACPFDESALAARWTEINKVLRQLRIDPATEAQLYQKVAAALPPLIPPHSLCTGGLLSALTQDMISRGSIGPRNAARAGPCRSDAGGPLIGLEADGLPIQLGVVSFPYGYEAEPCDGNAYPPFYVSVGAYADWINSVISNH
jgi:secreted trypsin-like serine protease